MSNRSDDFASTDEDEEELPAQAKRTRAGLPLGVTVLALLVCVYFSWDLTPAIRYWLSNSEPIDLGAPGSYHLDRSADGVYARITGVPGSQASRFRKFGTRYELVVVRGTNVLVRRQPRGPEPAPGSRVEPPPDLSPFTAQGRLVLDRSIPEYAQGFQQLAERGGAEPRNGRLFVLLDGERSRTGWAVPLEAAGLLALILVNAGSLARYALRARGGSGGDA